MSDAASVGAIVRGAREARGWSVEELCRRAHIQPVVLFNIEEDLDAPPSASALFFIARELELDYQALLKLGGHFPHAS